jgi:ubiquinone/menaquinone biosynthesis C-methylase UbiE
MYSTFVIKLQESFLTLGAKKRIEFMLQYIDITPGDILLDVGGNTGKITEAYARDCKEIVVLEPNHMVVEYGRTHRPQIKFVEGGAENIPFPNQYFDKIVASASFHHFSNQDRGLDEMKRVLKSDGKILIAEIDPNSRRGRWLRFWQGLVHGSTKFYKPLQLRKKVEEHGLQVLPVYSTVSGYFLTATKKYPRISNDVILRT